MRIFFFAELHLFLKNFVKIPLPSSFNPGIVFSFTIDCFLFKKVCKIVTFKMCYEPNKRIRFIWDNCFKWISMMLYCKIIKIFWNWYEFLRCLIIVLERLSVIIHNSYTQLNTSINLYYLSCFLTSMFSSWWQ